MIAFIGIFVVVASILGGFIMEGGHMMVLFQPAEFIIIGGAALGAMLIGSGPKVLKQMISQLTGLPKSGPSKQQYLDMLVMLYELLTVARRDGIVALESHVEKPEESNIISKYPSFAKNHHAVEFLADTMRLIISGSGVQAHDLEALMDVDLETHHEETTKPSKVLQVVGDSLPGLGIVAAVLGIVITMGAIDGPPEVIGHKVGAALVGTFLGVLLSYGFVQPLANNLGAKADEHGRYYLALKQVLLAFHKGSVAAIAVEFARRSIYSDVRPTFTELEQACRATRGNAA
ncbi:MAG: flagellar motor stator protein MotA [Candidatus Zixiibacteriota bacterium]